MIAPLRVFHRLRGPIDVIADNFRRRTFYVRHFALQPLPALVEPPRQRRRPAKTGLDHDHLEFWVPLEHAFQHDARQCRLLALRMSDHLLDIKARPARGRDWISTKAEGMHADRKPRLLCRLIDWPVAALAQRLDISAEQPPVHKNFVPPPPADFGRSGRTVLV